MLKLNPARRLVIAGIIVSFLSFGLATKIGLYVSVVCAVAVLAGMQGLCFRFNAPQAFSDICIGAFMSVLGGLSIAWEAQNIQSGGVIENYWLLIAGFLVMVLGAWFNWRGLAKFGNATNDPRFAQSGKLQMLGILTIPIIIGIGFVIYSAVIQIRALIDLKAES